MHKCLLFISTLTLTHCMLKASSAPKLTPPAATTAVTPEGIKEDDDIFESLRNSWDGFFNDAMPTILDYCDGTYAYNSDNTLNENWELINYVKADDKHTLIITALNFGSDCLNITHIYPKYPDSKNVVTWNLKNGTVGDPIFVIHTTSPIHLRDSAYEALLKPTGDPAYSQDKHYMAIKANNLRLKPARVNAVLLYRNRTQQLKNKLRSKPRQKKEATK